MENTKNKRANDMAYCKELIQELKKINPDFHFVFNEKNGIIETDHWIENKKNGLIFKIFCTIINTNFLVVRFYFGETEINEEILYLLNNLNNMSIYGYKCYIDNYKDRTFGGFIIDFSRYIDNISQAAHQSFRALDYINSDEISRLVKPLQVIINKNKDKAEKTA